MRRVTLAAICVLLWAFAACPAVAQRPSYDCWVLEVDESYVVLGIARDGNFIFRNRFQLADMDAVKTQCRAEIARLEGREARPIAAGKVDLSPPPPAPPSPPPPPPAPEELDLAAFLARVELVRKLAVIVPADDKDLADLRSQIAADLKEHPEWKDAL